MKRYYLALLGLVCFSGVIQAQSTRDLLKANVWRAEREYGMRYTKFDNTYFYDYSEFSDPEDGPNSSRKSEYFLSNTYEVGG